MNRGRKNAMSATNQLFLAKENKNTNSRGKTMQGKNSVE